MNNIYEIAGGKTIRIAISGRSGCGNTTVSRILADTLGISFINYTFRSLSAELNISMADIIEKAKNDFSYDRMVDTKQVALARAGSCVLGSRLAIWLLKEAELKVYLTANSEVRASRIMGREGGTLEQNMNFTLLRDSEDTRRYKELYNIDNTEFSFADIVIDTEKYEPEEIVSLILQSLEDRKLIIRG